MDYIFKKLLSIFQPLIKIGTLFGLTFNRHDKKTYLNSSHQETKAFFSKVNQEMHAHHYPATTENKPEIILKPDGFTFTKGRLDVIFENVGNSAAVIQEFSLGGEKVSMTEMSLGPTQKVPQHFDVTGSRILKEKLSSPNFEINYKDFATNKKYKTVGEIEQEPRADSCFNLGQIKNISFSSVSSHPNISSLEYRVLENLYQAYKENGQRKKWKATDAYKKLGIRDGQDISPLHDSKHIEITLDGTHECFVITAEGIRYMENM